MLKEPGLVPLLYKVVPFSARRLRCDMDRLLIVDDEEQILSAIRRQLSLLGDYAITTVTDPVQGLAYACGFEFGVVLVDYAMPRLDGVRFLEILREVRPATRGIVMSGRGEKEVLVCALNRGRAFHYIDKPWQPEKLAEVIDKGFKEYRQLEQGIRTGVESSSFQSNNMNISRLHKEYGIS